MIDTHCHVQFNAFKDDAEDVIKKCQDKNTILNIVGSQIDTSKRAIGYAEKYSDAYASVGLHPIHLFSTHVDEEEINFKSREEKFDYDVYKKLANHPKVIAIGECGLDFYRLPEGIDHKKIKTTQAEVFKEQFSLATELDLPLVIHVRNAYQEMADLLLECQPKKNIRGSVHCYTSNWTNAQKFLDLGLHLGFTGVITFPPKKTDPKTQTDLLEVVKNCPLDRIVIETDAPYLAPQAYRGQRCEPWMVEEVAKKIAEIKKISVEKVIEITTNNALNLFTKIKPQLT